MTIPKDNSEWYQDQVVFLTGATGNLGGCLLYKLAVKLPTSKIYVLCRGSMRDAVNKWESSMPEQIDDILDSGKIHCLTGDITQPDLGLTGDELDTLRAEVTVVIHSAASLSFFEELSPSIHSNCLPVVSLVRLAESFHKITAFVHISSISARSFLPGGSVFEDAEKLSPEEDEPEKQLELILETGKSPYTDRFFAPYGQAKYLAERFLLDFKAAFPILIIRPTNIGPAIEDPCPLYGPDGAIPVHTFFQLLFEKGERRKLGDLDSLPQHLIVEEIPVDIVANVCLLHLAVGSTGVVQAGSQLYVPVAFGEYIEKIRKYAPTSLTEKAARVRVEKNSHFANQADEMVMHVSRDWQIDCSRTNYLKETTGDIGLSLAGHDFESYFRRRIARQGRSLELWIDGSKKE